MARPRLMPGERELVRLRPSPAAWLGRYLLALLWAAWGGALAYLPTMEDLSFGSLLTLAVGVPALLSALLYVPRRRYMRLALGLLAAVGIAVLGITGEIRAVASGLALAGFMALLLTETDRRLRLYRLTSLRIVHDGGVWEKKPWTLHYDAVLDVDQEQGPLGRLFGYGTLVPVLAQAPAKVVVPSKRRKVVAGLSDIDLRAVPRISGVGRLPRVRHLLTCFVRDATATPFLREEQQTARRVADAIRALGSANVLH